MDEPGQPFSLAPGEGQVFPTPAGGQVTFKVRAVESSGKVSVAEFEVPAGAGPRLHVHQEERNASTSCTGSFGSSLATSPTTQRLVPASSFPGVFRTASGMLERSAPHSWPSTRPPDSKRSSRTSRRATPKAVGMRHPPTTPCHGCLGEPCRCCFCLVAALASSRQTRALIDEGGQRTTRPPAFTARQ